MSQADHSTAKHSILQVGEETQNRSIAYHHQVSSGAKLPGIMFLAGFKSDMQGSKAVFLAQLGAELGCDVTRFDYSGHGVSSGDFLGGTISRWLEESVAVFLECVKGPTILVGSSMGGWLAMLLNQKLRALGNKNVVGIVLIAPAVDMTQDLMIDTFTAHEQQELADHNRVTRPSDYGDPYILTRGLLEDGAKHLMFGTGIETGCPVHILQGALDTPVPVAHAQKLVDHVMLDPITMTLVPDGDHSLSRPQDLELLRRAIIRMQSGIDS